MPGNDAGRSRARDTRHGGVRRREWGSAPAGGRHGGSFGDPGDRYDDRFRDSRGDRYDDRFDDRFDDRDGRFEDRGGRFDDRYDGRFDDHYDDRDGRVDDRYDDWSNDRYDDGYGPDDRHDGAHAGRRGFGDDSREGRGGSRHGRHSSRTEPFLVRFAREWGWRAYAIPVLLVLTIIVVVDVVRGADATDNGDGDVRAAETGKAGPVPGGGFGENRDVGELPPGGPYTERSSGVYVESGTPSPQVGVGATTVLRYAVEVEDTIDASVWGGTDSFGAMIDATLADERGWIHDEAFAFEHVGAAAQPNLVFRLVSTGTAHERCGYEIPLETSCSVPGQNGAPTEVLINEARWVRGALTFQGDLGAYRQYLINHEVGHALGYAAHEACPSDGAVAPVMMQQTLSLKNSELHELDPNEVYPDDGAVCKPNAWPFPLGN